jgi:hypothetical protein
VHILKALYHISLTPHFINKQFSLVSFGEAVEERSGKHQRKQQISTEYLQLLHADRRGDRYDETLTPRSIKLSRQITASLKQNQFPYLSPHTRMFKSFTLLFSISSSKL